MKNLMKLALIMSIASFGLLAQADVKEYETSCSTVENVIENMNEKLPEDMQFTLECSDTHKSRAWGAIKYDYMAKIKLTNNIPLCENASFAYANKVNLPHGAHISISTAVVETIIDIMNDSSVTLDIGATGSQVGTMYHVKSVQFPLCD